MKIENLEITNIDVFKNEKFEGLTIQWIANIGFGEYIIYKDKKTNKWNIDDECLESKEDRKFGRMLFEQFCKDIAAGKIYETDEDDD